MGYNTHHFDKDAHYAAKTTKELEQLVVFWKDAVARHEGGSLGGRNIAINELAIVQLKLSERIGKKVKK